MNTTTATLGLPPSNWTTPFDIFLGAYVPALDGVLSRADQSIFIELLFWCCAYLVYGSIMSEWLRSMWSKTKAWNSGVKDKLGVFCGNAQDDIVLMNMLGMHHTCAGGMCLLGVLMNDLNLWRHGYMLELGFEIADVISMNPLFPMYPYRHDNMKIDAYVALLFHHIPSIWMGVLVFQGGLDTNEHSHQITFWFLLGAAVSCFGTIFVATRNIETQLTQATAFLIINTAFWYLCRFHIFKREAYAILDDVANDPTMRDTPMAAFMPKFGVLMTIFNSIVLLDVSARIVRYLMRMHNGTTALEWGTVPLSREDRFKKEGKTKVC